MTIKASGTLSFSEIQAEFGGAHPISLSEYYRGGGRVPSGTSAIPASGAIKLSNFYGTSNIVTNYAQGTYYSAARTEVKSEAPPYMFFLGGDGSFQKALFEKVIDFSGYDFPTVAYVYDFYQEKWVPCNVLHWGFRWTFTYTSRYQYNHDGSRYVYAAGLAPVMLFQMPASLSFGGDPYVPTLNYYNPNYTGLYQVDPAQGYVDHFSLHYGIKWRPNISGALYYGTSKYTDLTFSDPPLGALPADGNRYNKFAPGTNAASYKLEITYSPA